MYIKFGEIENTSENRCTIMSLRCTVIVFYHMHLISVIIIAQRRDSHVFECVYPTNTIWSVSREGGEESGAQRRIMGRRPAEVEEKGGKRKIRWQGGEEGDKG